MSCPSRKRKRDSIDSDTVSQCKSDTQFIDSNTFSEQEGFLYSGPDAITRFFTPVYKKTTWFDYIPITNKLSGSVAFGKQNISISLSCSGDCIPWISSCTLLQYLCGVTFVIDTDFYIPGRICIEVSSWIYDETYVIHVLLVVLELIMRNLRRDFSSCIQEENGLKIRAWLITF